MTEFLKSTSLSVELYTWGRDNNMPMSFNSFDFSGMNLSSLPRPSSDVQPLFGMDQYWNINISGMNMNTLGASLIGTFDSMAMINTPLGMNMNTSGASLLSMFNPMAMTDTPSGMNMNTPGASLLGTFNPTAMTNTPSGMNTSGASLLGTINSMATINTMDTSSHSTLPTLVPPNNPTSITTNSFQSNSVYSALNIATNMMPSDASGTCNLKEEITDLKSIRVMRSRTLIAYYQKGLIMHTKKAIVLRVPRTKK